jgi:pyruvate/2-oxoglutarate/acetoin dehydrogenase E1 component
MNYGEAVKYSMEQLAKDPRTLFIGYNLKFGSKAYGSLRDIDSSRIIEMPVAENLMAGMAMGLGFEGFRPVVIFERQDFMLNALDSLVNHLDKLDILSNSEFKSGVIIRSLLGSSKPINPGPQHSQDFTKIFRDIFKMKIYDPKTAQEVVESYGNAIYSNEPGMVIERRDFYGRR